MGAHRFASMEKRGESLEGSIATKSASVFDGMSEASHDVSEIFTEFTRTQLISGLSNKSFRKVLFLTGAGISVAAGIPDFRTPEIGLYAQVAKLGLEEPEMIFTLDYFKQKPETFYTVGGSLLLQEARPVRAHYFIKHFQNIGCLHKCFTQNIDGLEIDAGINDDLLIQAHGHLRTAKCIECKSAVDMSAFREAIDKKQVLRCQRDDCIEGLIKPDVTFFGEALPERFISHFQAIKDADLVFIMGTSLKVAPFNFLVQLVPRSIPMVLINRDINKEIFGGNPNLLFLQGDIEDQIEKLLQDAQWEAVGETS